MVKRNIYFIFILLVVFFIDTYASTGPIPEVKILQSFRTTREPEIDGKLDDEVWRREPDIDDFFISYSPVFGEVLPYRTRIWFSNDSHNLYFAFYCLDDEPEKIKSSIAKRDDMWKDDWIGFNLDMIGNKRFGYVLCVNPKGIQGDLYDSSATGVDYAPDYVWYSAGRVVEDGYIVEIKLPLEGFSYRSGENVEMNIIFERKIARYSLTGSWPEVPAGQGFFAGMTKFIINEIDSHLNLGAIPAITYGNIWERESPLSWSGGDSSTELGITAKYRVTSSIALEATINPDFSQVETDEFQILVNQRYPVFYSEKRPFYMETSKIFSLAGTCMTLGNLGSAVHTRKIVNPSWGAKMRGDLEAFSFSVLASADDWPGRKYYEGEENPFEGKKAHFIIGRSKLGIGSDNYVGTIITNRDFAGGYNRVIGGDMYYRFGGGNNFLKSHFLYTISKDEQTLRKYNGSALTLSYQHSSKSFDLYLDYEYFDDDFRMDTAFVRRLGISKFRSYLDFNIYPDQENFSWLKRMTPFVFGYYLHDITTNKDDYLLNGGIEFSLAKQGSVKVEYYTFSEYWKNVTFKGNYLNLGGEIQLTNWINLYAMYKTGDSIYYDLDTPCLGTGLSLDFKVLVQPNQNLAQYFQYIYQKLDRKNDRQRLYDLNILISRTTYQINKYLFLRAIVQYDSYLETILTDGLISFTLIPGTVLHLGIGGLYENLGWQEDRWLNEEPVKKYYQKSRSVFFKVSYLFQF